MDQIALAKARLYGKDGLGAKNFGMSPGTSRDVSAEQVAQQVNRAISQIDAGDYEVVPDDKE